MAGGWRSAHDVIGQASAADAEKLMHMTGRAPRSGQVEVVPGELDVDPPAVVREVAPPSSALEVPGGVVVAGPLSILNGGTA